MSGILIINDAENWNQSSMPFMFVLRKVGIELLKTDLELADLVESAGEDSFQYLNISDLSQEKFLLLLNAVQTVLTRWSNGNYSESSSPPDFRLKELAELIEQMKRDPRAVRST